MAKRAYTAAKAEANRRSDKANGKKILFYLKLSEDAEIIKSIDDAKAAGISHSDWLRQLFWRD